MLMPKRVKRRRVHRGRMTGKCTKGNKVAYGGTDTAAEENAFNAFTVFGIERASETEHHGEQGNAEKVSEDLRKPERCLDISRAPLPHRTLRCTPEKNGGNAEPDRRIPKKAESA